MKKIMLGLVLAAVGNLYAYVEAGPNDRFITDKNGRTILIKNFTEHCRKISKKQKYKKCMADKKLKMDVKDKQEFCCIMTTTY